MNMLNMYFTIMCSEVFYDNIKRGMMKNCNNNDEN